MTLASTANYINTGGGHLIYASSGLPASSLGSTTAAPIVGAWIPVHPGVRQFSVEALQTGSSAGALVTGSVTIQASNDGVTPLNSTLGIITFSSGASPQADGFTVDAHYNFIRAVGNTATTYSSGSSMSVIVSPHLVRM